MLLIEVQKSSICQTVQISSYLILSPRGKIRTIGVHEKRRFDGSSNDRCDPTISKQRFECPSKYSFRGVESSFTFQIPLSSLVGCAFRRVWLLKVQFFLPIVPDFSGLMHHPRNHINLRPQSRDDTIPQSSSMIPTRSTVHTVDGAPWVRLGCGMLRHHSETVLCYTTFCPVMSNILRISSDYSALSSPLVDD